MKKEALQDPTFWLHLVATLLSAVSTSGAVTDNHWLRIMSAALLVLNALGAGHAYGDADPNPAAVPGLDRSVK